MSSKSASLKARINNVAKEKNISAQALLQNYVFEVFLERLSESEYRDKFILKGGVLIASIVGLDNRSTMDLDATVRNLKLTEENIRAAIEKICSTPIDDDAIVFIIESIKPIRPDDIYGGFCVKMIAMFEPIKVPFQIDITTDDAITPSPIKFSLSGILDENKKIDLWAYNIETVLAEKLETILRRNILNSRARDFYDICILSTSQSYSLDILREAFAATAGHRGTIEDISDNARLLNMISESGELQELWRKYQQRFSYASGITWDEIIVSIRSLCNAIG